jgi:hypothetical protein
MQSRAACREVARAARGYDLADAGDVDGAPPGVHDVHAVADLALHDHLAGVSTFSRTVWRLYDGAKGLVMWYYRQCGPARSPGKGGGGTHRTE